MSITTFREQDLTGARFERVSLWGATFTQVFLNDASMHAVDLTGARVRGALFNESRMRGVELVDVEISGELQNVVVNGVDIAPLVETLRHLNFASAAWVGRMILGNASPWHQLDLPWDEAPGWDDIRGTARHDPRSRRCSRYDGSARRWSATSWNHSPTSDSPPR